MNENLKLVSHSGADLTLKQVYTDHRQIDRFTDRQIGGKMDTIKERRMVRQTARKKDR